MLTTSDSGIRQALLETAHWCGLQTLTAEPFESEQVRRQRALWDESSLLNWQSYRKSGRFSKKAEKMRKGIDLQSLILLGNQLRSASLKPRIELTYPAGNPEWELAVVELIGKRRELLTSHDVAAVDIRPEQKGKLLVYVPRDNLADGAAEYASNGFFDADNTPPWDTWFHYSGGKLFAWVPEVLIPLAHKGIEVNPEECIQWAHWAALSNLGV